MLIGAAVDYARWTAQRERLRAAADAAALAGVNTRGPTVTPNDKAVAARNFFNAQVGDAAIVGAQAQVVAAVDSVTVSATLNSRSFVAGLLGREAQQIAVTSRAVVAAPVVTKASVLDVAMCIDATSSMTQTIDSVRTAAGTFYKDLNAAIQARGLQPYDTIRLRLIAFRDFSFNGATYVGYPQTGAPLTEYPFQTMPAGAAAFQSQLDATTASGGGDPPESAMECLNAGMMSPWLMVGDAEPTTGKQIGAATPLIVLWSDAFAQPIPDAPRWSYDDDRQGVNAPGYPPASVMPRTMTDFVAKWNNAAVIDQAAKMYIVFGVCQKGQIMSYTSASGYPMTFTLQDGAWHHYDILQQLNRSMCGGTLLEGNDQMVAKIADGIKALGAGATGGVESVRLVQ